MRPSKTVNDNTSFHRCLLGLLQSRFLNSNTIVTNLDKIATGHECFCHPGVVIVVSPIVSGSSTTRCRRRVGLVQHGWIWL